MAPIPGKPRKYPTRDRVYKPKEPRRLGRIRKVVGMQFGPAGLFQILDCGHKIQVAKHSFDSQLGWRLCKECSRSIDLDKDLDSKEPNKEESQALPTETLEPVDGLEVENDGLEPETLNLDELDASGEVSDQTSDLRNLSRHDIENKKLEIHNQKLKLQIALLFKQTKALLADSTTTYTLLPSEHKKL